VAELNNSASFSKTHQGGLVGSHSTAEKLFAFPQMPNDDAELAQVGGADIDLMPSALDLPISAS
jgi:hypothetical protein